MRLHRPARLVLAPAGRPFGRDVVSPLSELSLASIRLADRVVWGTGLYQKAMAALLPAALARPWMGVLLIF